MNEDLRNKDNLTISLLNQLSKQTECITFLTNRFSNNAIDNNNNNNNNNPLNNKDHSRHVNNTRNTVVFLKL